MIQIIGFIFIMLALANSAFAQGQIGDLEQGMQFSGQLMNADGTPLVGVQNVEFDVLSGSCTVYSEAQSVTFSSAGRWTAKIGSPLPSAKRIVGKDSGHPWSKIFQNSSSITGYSAPGTPCTAGASAGNTRSLVVRIAGQSFSPIPLNVVPTASVAETLQGKRPSEFVQFDSTGKVGIGTASPVEKLDVAGKVQAQEFCISGNCVNSWPAGGGGGGTVTSVTAGAGLTGGPITTSGTLAVDIGTTANKVVALNASAQLPPVSGALLTNLDANNVATGTLSFARLPVGSTASTVAAGNDPRFTDNRPPTGPAGGDLTGTYPNPTLGVSGVVPGVYTKVTVDSKGRVTTGASLTASDILNVNASAITSGILTPAQGGTGSNNGSIIGSSELSISAGGINQNITLSPSGSGATVLNGNVGVGTTTPAEKLSVLGNARVVRTSDGPALILDSQSTTLSQGVLHIQGYSNDSNHGGNINARRARGTIASPTGVQAGDVLGGLLASGITNVGSPSPNVATIRLLAAENFTSIANGTKIEFATTPVGSSIRAPRLLIDDDGSVGIGTNSPQAILDVFATDPSKSAILIPRAGNFTGTAANGMVRYNTTSQLFEFHQNGAWVTYTTSVSDQRLKTKIQPVKKAIEIIQQLHPVYYRWDQSNPRTASFSKKREIGFLAQEVEQVLPEVVRTGEDSYRSVEYGKMVALAIAAIKDLVSIIAQAEDQAQKMHQENTQLKQRLDEQQHKMESLERRLQSLERLSKTDGH